ncbi:hypothetical protein niasHT_015649 [Heterodera trifolii]|uniref:Uncharacterized protein n=1 Tax=Heterodera trifolii TaxID=157864 RepID=A0ABD2L4C8_9BILA
MMGTLDIMAPQTTHYLNSQKPLLQEGSKLSQWRLPPKNQTSISPDEQPSSLGSQAHSSAGSDTDDSTHSGTNSQRQSPHFVAQQLHHQQQLNSYEHCPILGGWNVNAKSFRPVSSSLGHFPSSQHCQPVSDFSFPPPPIAANSHYSAQAFPNQVESINQQQSFVGGFHSNFVPVTDQNRHKEAIDSLGIGGTEMGVWQDPNAGLKRWQTYTGTNVWGDPEEKASLPIQRWQEFDEEDCVEMLTRLDDIAKKAPGTGQGWGALPTMDSLPAPLQRVHTHQSTGITQAQHRPYPSHQNNAQNYQQRRVHNPPNRQPAAEHGAALAHFASPSAGGAYPQQLQHNTFAQPQMCGWTGNDGFAAFGHHQQLQQQQRMGFAINGGNKVAPPSATAFHSVGGAIATNGWMGDGEMMTNDATDPNNVSLLVEQQLQFSSRNSAFPSAHFPFPSGDCFASVHGAGTTNSIW